MGLEQTNFFRNFHTVFRSGCTNIPTNSVQEFSFLHIFVYTCDLLPFLIIIIMTGVRWYLIVVLICISLMISDADHLFMFLLSICVSSLEKCLFFPFTHYLIRLLFWCWIIWVFCILWIWSPYCIYHLQKSPIQ